MSLLAELRRRNVYRAAVLYAASAWVLVQVVGSFGVRCRGLVKD